MSTTIYVTWDATKKDPLENIIADEDPIFNLCIFDYSGHYGDNRELLSLSIKHGHSDHNYNLFSSTTHGKGESTSKREASDREARARQQTDGERNRDGAQSQSDATEALFYEYSRFLPAL